MRSQISQARAGFDSFPPLDLPPLPAEGRAKAKLSRQRNAEEKRGRPGSLETAGEPFRTSGALEFPPPLRSAGKFIRCAQDRHRAISQSLPIREQLPDDVSRQTPHIVDGQFPERCRDGYGGVLPRAAAGAGNGRFRPLPRVPSHRRGTFGGPIASGLVLRSRKRYCPTLQAHAGPSV